MASKEGTAEKHGAYFQGNNRTRFALWAPSVQTVLVVTSDGMSLPMSSREDGWFSAEVECSAGTQYKFQVSAGIEVPDPASMSQAGSAHGYSVVIDHDAYRWQHLTWRGRPWHEAIIYELHVGLLGGFTAVKNLLPRLVDLGVTAVELMPLAQFSGDRNWGYDGVFPYAPQSSYGTPDELKALIDTAHGMGLAVILDVVYNHFGPDGNYLHTYAEPFFKADKKTPWGAGIDHSRREVRDFFIDSAVMWLREYRIDGLRLDAVHTIDDPSFLDEFSVRVRESCEEDRQVWLILENEHNEARRLASTFEAQWNDDGHNTLHVLLTEETDSYYADFAATPTEKLARLLKEGFVYQGDENRHVDLRGEPSGYLPPQAFVLFLQNHDQVGNRALGERLVHLTSERALRAATALVLLSPMVPLIFMGEELGSDEPFLFFTDFHDELAAQVCEGRRGEFSDFKAFSNENLREKIPDPNSLLTYERSYPRFISGIPDDSANLKHHRWLNFYRELLQIRRLEITPRLRDSMAISAVVIGTKAVSARWRMGDGAILRIDVNLGSEAITTEGEPASRTIFAMPSQDVSGPPCTLLSPYSISATLEGGP
jgi:maltooligosyltrehalose trehalohydrolase